MAITASELFSLFDGIRVGMSGARAAQHKPLLLLHALGDVQKQRPRLRPFRDIEAELVEAMRTFGGPRCAAYATYPFWRLQNDGLWCVEADEELQPRRSNSDPPRSELLAKNARGGFAAHVYDLLFGNADLQSMLIHRVLDAHFPSSLHMDIMSALDLSVATSPATAGSGDATFRKAVLDAYGGRCAVTGLTVSGRGVPILVEVAHIRWPRSGGSNDVTNGVALGPCHRKLFDLGFFTITADYRVRLSTRLAIGGSFGEAMASADGSHLRLPDLAKHYPSKSALAWHAAQVFRT